MIDSYSRWNHAVLSYFVQGVQRGTSIFLSVDDDVILQIGRELGMTKEESLSNFRHAIRQRVFENGRVKLYKVGGRNALGEPDSVAFLAAMVLAASRMAETEGTSQSNYFMRLREVLGLPPDNNHQRPYGMDHGSEEPLWQELSIWLQENGFLPSAYPGDNILMRYINYPISQALLRRSDRDRLRKLFIEKRWSGDLDAETLLMQIRREKPSLSQHLRELLDAQGQRYQAVAEAIYDFYEVWQSNPELSIDIIGTSYSFKLSMGLYRTEDYLSGHIMYFLYPRSPRRHHVEQLQVWFSGTPHTLTDERPGWYSPLGPIDGRELDQGAQYNIEQPADFNAFLLPQRQFWILIPDPENADSNVYATWNTPSLGMPFILLCRKELVPQLNRLRGERLIEWSGEPYSLPQNDGWVEICDCMIILQDWAGVYIENQQLHNALRPKQYLNISASGGLRIPKFGGWIEGYGPQITIFSFEAQANIRIVHVANNAIFMDLALPTNKPFDVPWPSPADYRVEASCRGEKVERLVKIVAWEQLRTTSPEFQNALNLGGVQVFGAYIEEQT